MNNLLACVKKYRKETILAPLLKMTEALFDLFVPLVMANIINIGIVNKDTKYILTNCGLLVLIGIVGLGCSILAQYFAARSAVGTATNLRHKLFAKIQTLDFFQVDNQGTSTLVTRMTNDVNQVQNGLNLFLRLFLRSPFIVFGSMLMAFKVNAKAAMIFLILIPILTVVVFTIILITLPKYKNVQAGLDTITGLTRENLQGVRVVRAFRQEKNETANFLKKNNLLAKMQIGVGKISSLMNPLTFVLINLAIVAILNTGAIEVNLGEIAQGDVIALVNYLNQILLELIKLANLIITLTKSMACLKRISNICDSQPTIKFGDSQLIPCQQAISFNDVSLAYSSTGDPAISHVSFQVAQGQTIGVIGGTGSGKSSIAHLLPRYYEPSNGSIMIFNQNINSYSRESLRKQVRVIMQKAQLFSGTIRSNLLWGNPQATEEDLWKALTIAQAKEFVESKSLQLDEPVEEGGRNFSGGQKQRLTIARALVGNPSIIILDDSASALDFATDAKLRKAIQNLPNKPTVIIISQRCNSIQNADQILVMDGGRLVAQGTHQQLLTDCAIYQDIYNSQYKKSEATK